MAVGLSDPFDEADKVDLECSICCHDYNWSDKCPRELECLHTFCTECLVRMEGHQPTTSRRISCPLCRYSTELGAPGALGLPRQQHILSKIPARAEHGGAGVATVSQQVILTLGSGETTVVTLPTISLSVEQGGRRGAAEPRESSLYRQSQKHQAVVCLRKASARLAALFILVCVAAFVFVPRFSR
ncbi:E3 ubiquitin-protein ligase RNF183-like [Pristis pectinata]|uniref:E3 ubiquitin-protein ligase RNF183-like n=1 Tax=Pristis pectinata TaxID=685728 RepID=UPI00223E459A|nr:E3 ubiquitin-protein ligase RNF183-like [Pristis pectinata]